MAKKVTLAVLIQATLADEGTEQTAEAVREALLENLDEFVIEQVQGEDVPSAGDYAVFTRAVIVAGKQTVDHFEARGTVLDPRDFAQS